MGILIAIDGVDASGKQTQTELLKKRLENNELKIKSVSFPAYDNPSSTLVKMYLNGEFGDKPSDVNAYATSTFFAADRFATYKTDWGKDFVTYEAAATLPVPGITSTQLTKDVTKIGEPFMIQALNGVKVKVTYEGGTTSPEISIMDASTKEGLNALAGNSHLITLSFLKTGEIAIEGTATVAPWQVGASGNGTVTE